MYHIALCDDEAVFADALSTMVKGIMDELCIPYKLDVFSSCEALWDVLRDKPDVYELLLLDIMMNGMNGLELAQTIRRQNEKVTIVFITSTPDFALQGYEVHAFHYLLKPISRKALKTLLKHDSHHTAQLNTLIVREGTVFRQLDIDKINYLETQGRKVAVFLVDDTILISARLPEMENQLPKNRFVRCHQSFILNMDKVAELRYGEAVMNDEKRVPVSRSYLKMVQKSFLSKLGTN